MKEVIRKEILHDLDKTIEILETRDAKDYEELKELSNHIVENVALYKDLDIISVTVLIYSIYKVLFCIPNEKYTELVKRLKAARRYLQNGKLGAYNGVIKRTYVLIQECNAKVKDHLQDVMQAARIKKGTILLEKGLSIGQAAGLMGLSNWDLQTYASKTTAFSEHHEKVLAARRLKNALQIFGVGTK